MYEILILRLERQEGDWTVTTHGPHGNVPHAQKHVHIKKRGLKGAYSWNQDGSRHDDHRFPSNEQMIKRAKGLAADALGVPEATLQLVGNAADRHDISVGVDYVNGLRSHHHIRVLDGQYCAIFDAGQVLVVVKVDV
jgi:hypothetical protein